MRDAASGELLLEAAADGVRYPAGSLVLGEEAELRAERPFEPPCAAPSPPPAGPRRPGSRRPRTPGRRRAGSGSRGGGPPWTTAAGLAGGLEGASRGAGTRPPQGGPWCRLPAAGSSSRCWRSGTPGRPRSSSGCGTLPPGCG